MKNKIFIVSLLLISSFSYLIFFKDIDLMWHIKSILKDTIGFSPLLTYIIFWKSRKNIEKGLFWLSIFFFTFAMALISILDSINFYLEFNSIIYWLIFGFIFVISGLIIGYQIVRSYKIPEGEPVDNNYICVGYKLPKNFKTFVVAIFGSLFSACVIRFKDDVYGFRYDRFIKNINPKKYLYVKTKYKSTKYNLSIIDNHIGTKFSFRNNCFSLIRKILKELENNLK